MPSRLSCLPLLAGLALSLGGCDSVNRAFEYASRPAAPPAAPEPAAATRTNATPEPPGEAGALPPARPEPVARREPLATAPSPPPDALAPVVPIVPAEPPDDRPEGEAGLALGVREGYLREARRSDRNEWLATQKPGDVSGDGDSLALLNAYVVLKPYRLPGGLYGAHSARFYVPRGVPRPTGDLGHSSIYDFNTRTCAGVACNF